MGMFDELFEQGDLDVGEDVDDGKTIIVYESHESRGKFFGIIAEETGLEWGEYEMSGSEVDPWKLHLKLNKLKQEFAKGPLDPYLVDLHYNEDDRTFSIRDDKLLEELWGADEGFSDEWSRCSDCSKFVFTSPTSYCDSGRYLYDEGELVCRSCVKRDPEAHLDRYLECVDTPEPIPFILDPGDVGLVPVEETTRYGTERVKFQNGLHEDMCDDPKAMRKYLLKANIRDVIFDVAPSQFYVEWTVWTRPYLLEPVTALLTGPTKLFVGGRGALIIQSDNGVHDSWYIDEDVLDQDEVEVPHARWEDSDEDRWSEMSSYGTDFQLTDEERGKLFSDPDRVLLSFERLNGGVTDKAAWEQVGKSLKEYPTPAQRCKEFLKGASIAIRQQG